MHRIARARKFDMDVLGVFDSKGNNGMGAMKASTTAFFLKIHQVYWISKMSPQAVAQISTVVAEESDDENEEDEQDD